MEPLSGARDIERALLAVGELLAAAGERYSLVVIGGAALNLLGVVKRATRDVDVLAVSTSTGRSRATLVRPPDPLPAPLATAIRTVGRDFDLADDWLNAEASLQWITGLPPGLEERVQWRKYASLRIGIAGRRDLIWLKLFAAADQGGRHARDLLALRPTDHEIAETAEWVKGQDQNKREFPNLVDEVVTYVQNNRDAADR
jgi:hypothetical protein